MVTPVEFDTHVTNGTIEIPTVHRSELQGAVHVIVIPQPPAGRATKIDELLASPLQIPEFRPLARDEAHER
jgi:hypothetical protein